MQIQVLSDIHFEVCKNPERLLDKILPPYPEKNTVLVLAGDIGYIGSEIYMKYIEKCSELYDAVFLVAGNHEYYNSSLETVNNLAHTLKWPSNVYYLDRTSVIHRGVRFLGCTLWATAHSSTCKDVNDFIYITDITVEKYNDMHHRDLAWLENELDKPQPNEEYTHTVVITHHLPSQALVHSIYKTHYLNPYYANSMDDLVRKANMWFCGHTHMPVQRHIGNCWCAVNPVGYTGEHSKCNMKQRFTVK
jgi:predicted phosphodiesterase